MRVGISLTSNHPDVKGARWMIERAAAARRSKPVDVRRDQGRTGLPSVLSKRIRSISRFGIVARP
jgi:hypothetical protein